MCPTAWMNLENLMLNEGNQMPKTISYESICLESLEQANPYRLKVDKWLLKTRGRAKWGVNTKGYQINFRDDENILKLDIVWWLHNSMNMLKTTEL